MVCGILHVLLLYVTLSCLKPGPEYSIVELQELLAIPDTAPHVHLEDLDGSVLECVYVPLYNDTVKHLVTDTYCKQGHYNLTLTN